MDESIRFIKSIEPVLNKLANKWSMEMNIDYLRNEVLTDTLTKIYKSYNQYDSKISKPQTWAGTILRNTFLEALLKEKNRLKNEVPMDFNSLYEYINEERISIEDKILSIGDDIPVINDDLELPILKDIIKFFDFYDTTQKNREIFKDLILNKIPGKAIIEKYNLKNYDQLSTLRETELKKFRRFIYKNHYELLINTKYQDPIFASPLWMRKIDSKNARLRGCKYVNEYYRNNAKSSSYNKNEKDCICRYG